MSGAPSLTRPLVLEGRVQTPDGAGGFTLVWQGLGTLWAEVTPGAGRDVTGQEVMLSAVAYRITVRAAPQGAPSRPMPGQRFREGARVFAIVAVTEAGGEVGRAGRYLTCFAREEVPA